jgi:HD-GYP domain-containing protein (c-di-GMP phosphodiesterase class II)
MNRRDPGRLEARTAIGAFGLGAAALVIALIAGASPAGAALVGFAPLAFGAGAMFAAWRRAAGRAGTLETILAETRAEAAAAAERQAAAEAERDALREAAAERDARHGQDRERLQHAVRRAEEELGRQRELMKRLAQSRRAEREWNRELRAQLQRLYDVPGAPGAGDDGDVRDLVLRTAIKLVEAPKGMLLSREDADGDGALDVVVSHGFEHDPTDSDVAQRFARQVLRSDEIVREDEPVADSRSASDADMEIESLVAIPLYLRDRFHGVIVCANRPGGFDEVNDDVLLALGDHAGAALHHGQLHNELNDARHAAVRTLLETMAARDLQLHQESTGLTLHALALARELELDSRSRDVLVCATLLRHIGYVAVPEQILREERPLRPDERSVVELHTRVGFNIIGQVPALRAVAEAVLYHHERFDGTGYPAGLAGEAIPAAARALAVLEAYAAMTNERPYRRRRSLDEACDELVAAAGTQFDPEIVQLLVEEVRRGPLPVDEALTDAVVEALPLNLAGGADAGPLAAASTDGLTLLGNQRALHSDLRDAVDGATPDRPFAVALVQLEDLPAVNDDIGYAAGDHLIQVAARNAQRAAARFGGRAYRASGRRLAILTPIDSAEAAAGLLTELLTEFAGGSAVRTSMTVWSPGDRAVDVLGRARASVMRDVA